MLRAERVEHPHELRVARVPPHALEILRPDQRVPDHLVEPEAGQDSTHDVSRLARVGPIRWQRGLRQPPVDALVAIRPSDLLGDVGGDDDVQAMRRHLDLELVALAGDAEPERLEQLANAPGVELHAEQPAHPRDVDRDPARRLRLGVVVDDAARDPRAGDLRNQPRGAVDRVAREVVTDPLLVAHARLGAEAEAAGRVADRRPVEDRRFEDDPRRPLPHLGRGAAHDPGKADRPLAIGDDEHLLVELALDVIDRHQSFPRARPADDDLASGNRVGVIGMHRLPELVHHVVRDVHHRADRPHPGRDQPALHPVRRRSVRHVRRTSGP